MSFKEINRFALFVVASFALIGVFIAVFAFTLALTVLSNWFVLLVIAWFLGGLYGLVMAVWGLLEWSTDID